MDALGEPFFVWVVKLSGQRFKVVIENPLGDYVGAIKYDISFRPDGWHPVYQRLSFNGVMLDDNERFSKYEIPSGSEINLTLVSLPEDEVSWTFRVVRSEMQGMCSVPINDQMWDKIKHWVESLNDAPGQAILGDLEAYVQELAAESDNNDDD